MKKQKKALEIITKFINNLILNGKKSKSEKILAYSVKKLQKALQKSTKKVVQFALIVNTPIFKLNTIAQKKGKNKKVKVIPAFIFNQTSRICFAMRFIIKSAKKRKQQFLKKLPQKILFSAQYKDSAILVKKDIQKQALMNSYLFKNYRWH